MLISIRLSYVTKHSCYMTDRTSSLYFDTGIISDLAEGPSLEGCLVNNTDYPPANDIEGLEPSTALSLEDCAARCAASEGCEAVVFLNRGGYPKEGTPNCYFKGGLSAAGIRKTLVPEPAAPTDIPRATVILQACGNIDWAQPPGVMQTTCLVCSAVSSAATCLNLPRDRCTLVRNMMLNNHKNGQ
jgi:hypothetical protein